MDVIDQGCETAQLLLDVALRNQKAAGTLMKFTGHCYNCGEPVEAPLCYCDVDYQADHEKRKEIHAKTHHYDA